MHRGSTPQWLRAYEVGTLVLFAVIGIAVSIMGFYEFRDQSRADLESKLQRDVSAYAASLREQLDRHLLVVNSVQALFAASDVVAQSEFRAFTQRILSKVETVRAIAWHPRVSAANRAAFEAEARSSGLDDFTVRVPPAETAVGLGPVSYPVRFVEPVAGNQRLLGADVFAMPERRRALEEARDTGDVVASERIRPLSEPSGDFLIVLHAPVYESGRAPVSVAERRERIAGFVGASFNVTELMRIAFGSAAAEIVVIDEHAPPDRQLLHYRHPSAAVPPLDLDIRAAVARPHVKRSLDVGGRQWSLYFLRPTYRLLDQRDLAAWMVLAIGLGLILTLTTYGLGTMVRARRTENLGLAITATNENLRREISERRQVEQALRKSEDRLRLAIKSAKLSLFSQDRDLRYTWIYKSRLGLTPQETLGRTDDDLMPPEAAVQLGALKRRVLDSGIGATEDVPVNLHGRSLYFSVTIEPLFDGDGAISGIIGSALDITNEYESQQVLARARVQAERANEAKTRFLAAASHDLRQPLQATRLFLEVLLLKLADSQHLAIAEKALAALEASDGLLNTLLDISTLEAGIVVPETINFPVQRLLDRMANETLPQAAAKNLRFRCVPCSAVVRSDPILLERIIRNLISNALRYTQKGGLLLGCRRRGDGLVIEVWDTGPGIPEDQLEAVFEDFFQLDNPSRDRQRGLGLGLSVVDRMARLLGHQVALRSRVGRGSVFGVAVPCVGQPARRPRSVVG